MSKIPIRLHEAVSKLASDGHGHVLFGSGNPDDDWMLQDNAFQFKKTLPVHGVQLGSEVIYRTGDVADPTAVDIAHNKLEYHMPAGPQVVDPAHDVTTARADRGATSFNYSFVTKDETLQEFLESGGQMKLHIDLDPRHKDKGLDLHAVFDPILNPANSHIVWEDKKGNVFIADDGGNDHATQNSQNLAFYQSLIDVDPKHRGIQTGPVSPVGEYDIIEEIRDPHHHVMAHIDSHLFLV